MSYTYTTVEVGTTWTEISADVVATKVIQVQHRARLGKPDVEVMAASSQPASDASGISMMSGDVMTSGLIEDLGASGKVWARVVRTSLSAAATKMLVVTVGA